MRAYYFKDMQNLRYLYLQRNRIATIEPDAFVDLTSVRELQLQYNLIETLDDYLLYAMVHLERLDLSYNKIKHMGFATVNSVRPDAVFLKGNVCIDNNYSSNNLTLLEDDLEAGCSD